VKKKSFDIQTVDTSSKPFQEALNLVQYTQHSVFLTGKAGTGKSTFLKYITSTTKKKYVVLAPTGIAAVNAGGVTLHSFFRLPFYPMLPDDPNLSTQGGRIYKYFKFNDDMRQILQDIDLIIIDEISMVRADMIDVIDRILRVFSRNRRQPFGGKQLLLVGDVYQLEPVLSREDREHISTFYPNPYFFSAKVFQEMQLVSIELTQVFRQKDPDFVALLDRVRNNSARQQDYVALNQRHLQSIPERTDNHDFAVTLCSRRDTVDAINTEELGKLPGAPVTLLGQIDGEYDEKNLPTNMELHIKVGAQVIFVKNNAQKLWVNGTVGVISSIDELQGILYIITEDGIEHTVHQEMWNNMRYTYNKIKKEIEEEVLGTYTQFPIKLAWAITIHKCQGLTFRRAVIDLGGGAFAPGMTYVALSRCSHFDGLFLKQPISQRDVMVRAEVNHFASTFNNQKHVQQALGDAQADLHYRAANTAFARSDFDQTLIHLFKAMHLRYDIERPSVVRLLRRKLGEITRLKSRIKALEDQQEIRDKKLKRLAAEFVQMGDDCLEHDMLEAAMANYNKAITVYPKYKRAWSKIRFLEKKNRPSRSSFDE